MCIAFWDCFLLFFVTHRLLDGPSLRKVRYSILVYIGHWFIGEMALPMHLGNGAAFQ